MLNQKLPQLNYTTPGFFLVSVIYLVELKQKCKVQNS